MNETTPEKNKNLKELGNSLMVLATGTFAQGLADTAAGIGAFIRGIGDFFAGLGAAVRGWGEEKEAKAMERKIEAYLNFINAAMKLSKIDIDELDNAINTILEIFDMNLDDDKVDDIYDCLEDIIYLFELINKFWKNTKSSFKELGEFLVLAMESVSSVKGENQISYLGLLVKYLNELNDIIEDLGNPVITPVLDLTSFREGMEEVRKSFDISGGYVANYSAIASASNKPRNYNDFKYMNPNGYTTANPSMNIYNNFEMNDAMMYGESASRNIANSIEYAIKSSSNLFEFLWNLW
jgi:hypothetical protein